MIKELVVHVAQRPDALSSGQCRCREQRWRQPCGQRRRLSERPSGSWGTEAGSSDADYCLGSVYLLDAFLHNSEVGCFSFPLCFQMREISAQRGRVTCPSGPEGWGVGWWFRRQTDRRPPGSSTQTLKTRAFKDCVDLKKNLNMRVGS